MKTEIVRINPGIPRKAQISRAAGVIINGGLVAFPTETVYGLGANAFNETAVKKIFEAKARPFEDPLIVHISDGKDLNLLARDIPSVAFELAEKFWPGPLTLILKKAEKISSMVTGGLDTVAVRMPDHQIALSLIEAAKAPIAAPSANLFGRTSPTSAEHVLQDLDGKIDMVIDGGKTSVGVESTILDLTGRVPRVLRPGGIACENLKRITPVFESHGHKKIVSPGMYRFHYSPKARLILVEGKDEALIKKVRELAEKFEQEDKKVGIVAVQENKEKYPGRMVKTLGPRNNLSACAANLFSVLRECDDAGVDVILSEGVSYQGLGAAIMDRLKKAGGV